jgi:hypothetical protein
MVEIGLVNSRMKHFFDVAIAANRLTIDGSTLAAALLATFSRRQTAIPEGVAPALTETQSNWTSFVTRSGLENPGTLTPPSRRSATSSSLRWLRRTAVHRSTSSGHRVGRGDESAAGLITAQKWAKVAGTMCTGRQGVNDPPREARGDDSVGRRGRSRPASASVARAGQGRRHTAPSERRRLALAICLRAYPFRACLVAGVLHPASHQGNRPCNG